MFGQLSRMFVILLVIASFLLGWMLGQWQDFIHSPLAVGQQSVTYVVKSGYTLKKISTDLAKLGVLSKPKWFEMLARLDNVSTRIHAGEYDISSGTTPTQLLDMMVNGTVKLHKVTIIEGKTFDEVLKVLNATQSLSDLLKDKNGQQIMSHLGKPKQNPEGRFFPETYRFPIHTKEITILQRAYSEMEKHLESEWSQRAPATWYHTPTQALTVASIIEKEAGNAQERPLIAAVILRRLRIGMPLQIDATVIYGLRHDFDGNITKADLRKDTPYNTYVHKGLPPTPICMPGLSSLHAALHPAETKALYFVSRGDGTHVFSENLKQHERAVQKYQLKKPGPKIEKPVEKKLKIQKKLKSKRIRHGKKHARIKKNKK